MHWGVFAISAAHLYQNYLEEPPHETSERMNFNVIDKKQLTWKLFIIDIWCLFFIKKCHKIFGPPLYHLGQPKRASFQALEEVHRRNTSDKGRMYHAGLGLITSVLGGLCGYFYTQSHMIWPVYDVSITCPWMSLETHKIGKQDMGIDLIFVKFCLCQW